MNNGVKKLKIAFCCCTCWKGNEQYWLRIGLGRKGKKFIEFWISEVCNGIFIIDAPRNVNGDIGSDGNMNGFCIICDDGVDGLNGGRYIALES